MIERGKFSDEDLTAYLDGECEPALARDIEAAIAADQAVGNQLARLQLDREKLEDAFDRILAAAPDGPSELGEERGSRSASTTATMLRYAATALLCLGLGFSVARWFENGQPGHWHQYVAAYQALYANKTLAHIRQSDPNANQELDRVTAAIGIEIDLTDVTQVELLDYKRAQILAYEGQPLIQLAFLSKLGIPVALCIMRSVGPQYDGIAFERMEGMQAAAWSKGGFDFLLIGGADKGLIMQTAEQFYAGI